MTAHHLLNNLRCLPVPRVPVTFTIKAWMKSKINALNHYKEKYEIASTPCSRATIFTICFEAKKRNGKSLKMFACNGITKIGHIEKEMYNYEWLCSNTMLVCHSVPWGRSLASCRQPSSLVCPETVT